MLDFEKIFKLIEVYLYYNSAYQINYISYIDGYWEQENTCIARNEF